MDNTTLLNRALLANSAFSVLTGSLSLLFAGPISAVMGGFDPLWVGALGPGLLGFAGLTAWTATRPSARPRLALAISVADLGWVLGSFGLVALTGGVLSSTGIALVLGVAAIVGAVAAGQLAGIARIHRSDGSRGHHRSMLVGQREIRAPAGEVWAMVSDVEAYAAVAPNLSSAEVVSGSGSDMVRRCTDRQGRAWLEQAALWEDGRAYAFDVQTGAPDYPYPFRSLRGEWSVAEGHDGCTVTMRFDFTLPGGILGDVLATVSVVPKFRPVLASIFDAWQAAAERGEAVESVGLDRPVGSRPADGPDVRAKAS
ncbi:MAG: SRPBCC family protein [Proteobacteria bacterium]|nr:SRPBCC family protein [Pseudomonadota bacterium]